MSRERQPALTTQQMERVVRAYLLGAGEGASQEGAIAAVNWATEVVVRASVLEMVFTGEALLRIEPDGDYRVRRTTEEERRYIVDERELPAGVEEEASDRAASPVVPGRPGRLVPARRLPRRGNGKVLRGW